MPESFDPNKLDEITVNMKLINDSQTKALEKIFSNFALSIKSLETVMGNFETQIRAATQTVSGTSLQSTQVVPDDLGKITIADNIQNRVIREREEKAAADQAREEQAAREKQGIATKTLQFFSQIGHRVLHPAEALSATSKALQPGASFTDRATGVLAASYLAPYMYNTAVSGAHKTLQIPQRIGNALGQPGLVGYGQGLGYSRSGILGTPLFSPAFMAGIGSGLQGMEESWFGLNTNYSSQQAMEAQQIIQQMGYAGNTKATMADAFNKLAPNTGIDQKTIGTMLDYGYRYGASGISQMVQAIQQIPAAAREAQMNVNTFAQQLAATAQEVGQSRGITNTAAQSQVQLLSQVTGFDPATAAGPLNNPLIQGLSASQLGGNFYQAAFGPGAGARAQGNLQHLVEIVTGKSWSQLSALMKTPNNPEWGGKMGAANRIYTTWLSDKNFFGGYTPAQIYEMIGRGGNPAQLAYGLQRLQFAQTNNMKPGTPGYTIGSLESQLGLTAAEKKQFSESVTMQHIQSSLGFGGEKSYQQQLQALQKYVQQNLLHQRQTQKQVVQLALNPEAAKLVRFLGPDRPDQRVYNVPIRGGKT